jgi:hypothetical protein
VLNNPPEVTTTLSQLAYVENAGAVAVDTGLTASDADSANLASATVQITGNYASGQDVLGFTDQGGITGNWNATTGMQTLTGTATVAVYQAALRTVTYTNTSENPNTLARTVSFKANDGSADSNTATRTINVTAVNDAPTLNAIGNPAAINKNAGQQTVNLTGITAGGGESQTLQVTATSSNTGLIPNPTLIYTSPNTTGSLTYTPLGNASGTAVVTVTVRDAGLDGMLGNADDWTTQRTFTVMVNAFNYAPTLSGIEGTALVYSGGAGATAITSALAARDVDNTNLASATVRITSGYQNGQDVLSFANTATITGDWDATLGKMTLTGSDTVANYQAALRTVKYQDTSSTPNTSTRTVGFTINDGTANSNTSTRNILVSYRNLAGTFGAPGSPLPSSVIANALLSGNVSVVVRNLGNVALPSGQQINIQFVARDLTNPANPDIVLATLVNQSVSALAANGSKTFTASVSRPAGLPADTYQILAVITPVQPLIELSTSDNVVTSPTKTITAAPAFRNLAGTFGTTWTLPSSAIAGTPLSGKVSVVVSNLGNVALPSGQQINIQFVARDLTNPANPDIVLATLVNQSVSALAAKWSKTFTATVSRPAGPPADTYQILANIVPVQPLAEDASDNLVTVTATNLTKIIVAS